MFERTPWFRNFHSSTTKRCAARREWADKRLGSDQGSDEDFTWLCDLKHPCKSGVETCRLYRGLQARKETLAQEEEALAEAKEKLQERVAQAQEELTQAQKDLAQAKEKLTHTTRDLSQAQNESHQHDSEREIASLSRYVDFKKEAVDRKKEEVDRKKEAVDSSKSSVNDKKLLLRGHCKALEGSHVLVVQRLVQARAAGKTTDYMTECTGAEELNEEAESFDSDDAGTSSGRYSPSGLEQRLNAGKKTISPYEMSLAPKFQAQLPRLGEFYKFCDAMLQRSKPCPLKHLYMSKEFIDCIRTTVQAIVSWEPGTEVGKDVAYFRPSAVAEQTMALESILFAIIWKVSTILGDGAHLKGEQPGQNVKSKQWTDAMMSPLAKQHLFAAFGNIRECAIEIKPLSGESKSYKKLVAKGADQVVGHEGELLWSSFLNFCNGLGRNGQASGMVLTMASVNVMTATMKHVGTEDVDHEFRNSGNLPLFSRETTQNLFREYTHKDKKSVLSKFNHMESDDGWPPMAAGFRALACFVMGHEDTSALADGATRATIDDDGDSQEIQIGNFLGSGAFASVHEVLLNGKSLVAKIENVDSHSVDQLRSEFEVLKRLTYHPCLPVVMTKGDELAKLTARQRCEQNTVGCLLLQLDVGTTARDACLHAAGHGRLDKLIGLICTETISCLHHVHQQGFVHLDIQPRNIIVVAGADGSSIGVRLIDWGCATKEEEIITEYRGCPPFCHEEMLVVVGESENCRTKKGTPRKILRSFDECSLALTAACLLSGQPGVPWEGFDQWKVDEARVIDRREQAICLISESGLPFETKGTLLSYLGVVKKETRKRLRG